MKIAIFYESKFEEAEHIAHFLAHQIGINGNEVKLLNINQKSQRKTFNFSPEVILIAAPPHKCKWPCHFGKTAAFLKKLGKFGGHGGFNAIKKIGAFNCNEPANYNCKIKDRIRKFFPQVQAYFFPSLQTNYYRIFDDRDL